MCGLVGIIHNSPSGFMAKEVDIFEQMLFVDTLRGDDATGVALVSRDQGVRVTKEATTANYFLMDKEWNITRSKAISSGKALLGHNRKATIGKATDENLAHPFVIDDRYVFFHNGTIHCWRGFVSEKDKDKIEMDSQALGYLLTRCEGDKEKLEEALGKVSGAYATVWYDKDLNRIYLLRNKERPLVLAKIKNVPIWIYGSEPWIVQGVANRNGFAIDKWEPIEEHKLYTFYLSSSQAAINLAPEVETLEPKKASSPQPIKAPITAVGEQNGTTSENSVTLSKNAFRKLEKELLGEEVLFWMDDYTYKNLNSAAGRYILQPFSIWGHSDNYPGCLFRGELNGHNEYEMDELVSFGEVLVSGRVSSMTFLKDTRNAVCYVTNVKLAKRSTTITTVSKLFPPYQSKTIN